MPGPLSSARLVDHLTVCALAAAALVLGVLMRPDAGEQSAALIRDGRVADAVAFSTRTSSADPAVLLQTIELLGQGGRFEERLEALEAAAARFPGDAAILQRLLAALSEQGSETRMLEVARSAAERWGHPEALRIALDALRRRGDVAAEAHLLRQAAFMAASSIAALERLGQIEAGLGHIDAAIQAFGDADASRPGLTRPGQLTLLRLLVERGNLKDAERRASRWITFAREGGGAAEHCAVFASEGHPDAALRLITRAAAEHTWIAADCIELLLLQEEEMAARSLMALIPDHSEAACPSAARLATAGGRMVAPKELARWTHVVARCESELSRQPDRASYDRTPRSDADLAHSR